MNDIIKNLRSIIEDLHEAGCDYIEGFNYPKSQAAGMYKCDCTRVEALEDLDKLEKLV